jgi:hypothetical protein
MPTHHLSSTNFEWKIVDDDLIGPRRVGEADVLELDVAEEAVIRNPFAAGSPAVNFNKSYKFNYFSILS